MESKNVEQEAYEAPKLTEYGTIEEWTKGPCNSVICISLILP